MLLVLIARHSERVEWLEKFGHRLLTCVEKGEWLCYMVFLFCFFHAVVKFW
jgi:hypothetical protein